MFTLEAEENDCSISYYPDPSKLKPRENQLPFDNFPSLLQIIKDGGWDLEHLAMLWNSFAGIPPFGELKPLKTRFKCGVREAVQRIWDAIQRLRGEEQAETAGIPTAAEPLMPQPVTSPEEVEVLDRATKSPRKRTRIAKKAEKSPASKPKLPRTAKTPRKAAEARKDTKKAEVMRLISREKGASAAELLEKTGWQAHTLRGAISTLGSKAGFKTRSEKSETRGLVYYAA